jgi:type I restriction enzyme S subunit
MLLCDKLFRLRLREELIDARFLVYVVNSRLARDQMELEATGASDSMQNIGQDTIRNLRIPLPPLPEQRAIADFLDRETGRIDELVAKKRQMVQLLGEQRHRIVDRVVTEGLNKEPGDWRRVGSQWRVPCHWSIRRLKLVVKEIVDTEHKTAPFYQEGEYLVVRTSNVRYGRLVLDDAKYTDLAGYLEWTSRGRPNAGDILFTREAPAGEACLVPEDVPLCLGQRMVLFRVDPCTMDSRYLLWAIYGGLADEFIRLLSQGSTVQHFNMSDIANIPITVPPLNEQPLIAEYLAQQTALVDAIVEREQATVRVLQERRQVLITAAVAGQIDARQGASREDQDLVSLIE